MRGADRSYRLQKSPGSLSRRAALLLAAALTFLPSGPALAQLFPNLGGQRAGISAFQFLKIGAGARGAALGETFAAVANDVSALYWNPAGLTQFSENEFIAAHTSYVVDLRHEFFGAVYHLTPTDAVGISVTSLHTDDMEITTETQPFGTGRYFSFGDLAVGVSYARQMTDQFSFGVTFRYVEETLDVLKMRGAMFDLGTYYWTGLGSARFAIVITNFGGNVRPTGEVRLFDGSTVEEFQPFSPPTQFKLGVALEPYETEQQRVTTSVELNHPNDNAENIHLGVEYGWEKWLKLRLGLRRTIGEPFLGRDNASAASFSAGLGVWTPVGTSGLGVDYAYSSYGLLGGVHRISLILSN